ncbi:MAG: transporter substrate-binding domain-containing protein [Solobacterium sp.]|nr:transporter substrate-binding domain-containing protein [Solobacterium sp.]
MKQFLMKAIVLCGMSFLLACGSTTNTSSAPIVIAMSPDYPPFDDVTTSGELTGFDYEMGEWIFDWLNQNGYSYTHEWKAMSFDTIITAINADQVDLGISGFTYAEDRKVLFSNTYYDSSQVALLPSDSSISSLDDLYGKAIGVQLGSTGESAANELVAKDASTTVTSISDMGICVETLKSGGFDAVILDIAIAKNYEKSGEFKVLEEVLVDEQMKIIAKEGNTELMDAINKALDAFLESDAYPELLKTYGIES